MAEDDAYKDKVFSPESKTDPRAAPRYKGEIVNPPARVSYPGGAGNPGQEGGGEPKSKAAK